MCSRPPSAVRRRHGRGLEALVPALVGPQVVPVDRRDGGRGPVSPSRTRHGSRARDIERDATRGSTDHGRTDGGGGDARARQLTPFWLSARLRAHLLPSRSGRSTVVPPAEPTVRGGRLATSISTVSQTRGPRGVGACAIHCIVAVWWSAFVRSPLVQKTQLIFIAVDSSRIQKTRGVREIWGVIYTVHTGKRKYNFVKFSWSSRSTSIHYTFGTLHTRRHGATPAGSSNQGQRDLPSPIFLSRARTRRQVQFRTRYRSTRPRRSENANRVATAGTPIRPRRGLVLIPPRGTRTTAWLPAGRGPWLPATSAPRRGSGPPASQPASQPPPSWPPPPFTAHA
jgi:hypothetical protein